MANINPYENSAMKAMLENMRMTMSMFASNPALESAVRQANKLASNSAIQAAMGITSQFNNVFSGNEKAIKSFLGAFSFQTELLRNTQQFYLTETISAFRNSLMHNNYFSAIESITKSLQDAIIEVPDIALLRLNKPLLDLIDVDLPRGLRTSIDNLHAKQQ